MLHTDFEITPAELVVILAQPSTLHQLVDVRRQEEHDLVHLPNSRLIPLHELAARTSELDREGELVVYCHHGVRSLNAAKFLRQAGFSNVKSLAGGIDRWSIEVDPSVARY